jgi:16S rRNA processing protein RimM
MSQPKDDFVVLGKLTSPFGVQGWVKVYSYTDPVDSIFQHKSWSLWLDGKHVGDFVVSKGQKHSKGLIVLLKNIQDRTQIEKLCGSEIRIPKETLPELEDGDYYWHQLEGLEVVTVAGVNLGRIAYLMETGANDVVVIHASSDSVDDNERLIPYLIDQVVKEVNLSTGKMVVDWDPDF